MAANRWSSQQEAAAAEWIGHYVGRASPGFRHKIADALKRTALSPAAWFFAAIWLASALVLSAFGGGISAGSVLIGLVVLVLCLVLLGATEEEPVSAVLVSGPRRGGIVWAQFSVAILFISLTEWTGLHFHGVAADSGIPLWTPLEEWLLSLGEQWLGSGNGTMLLNPITYFVIPLAVLLLIGTRLKELGFGRGHRVGRALLIVCALPVAWIAFLVLSAHVTVARMLGTLASNFIQNGFFEEFLFRGVLQTRLRLLAGTGWAIVLQALVFGIWHLGLGFTTTEHAGLIPAIASTIVYQSLFGPAFGIMFERTRNLLVPSVAHVVLNSVG